MPKPRSLAEIVNRGARLQHISQRARAAVALKEQVQAALPEQLARHITGVVHRGPQLVLAVDSPAFCARLRFESPRLKAAVMVATGLAIERINIKVQQPPR